jgi:hypothetical protein
MTAHPEIRTPDHAGAWPAHAGPAPAQLTLVRETQVAALVPDAGDRTLEASGVLVSADRLYVIFDNTGDIAELGTDLAGPAGNRMIPQPTGLPVGYEDIARDPRTGHYYVLIEALPRDGGWQARVEEFDSRFVHLGSGWLELPLPSPNKGLEGLTCLRRDGVTYLLGLSEGNLGLAGKAGRRPGGGRIHVFRRGRIDWEPVDTIDLPSSVRFVDYSSLSVLDGALAVVSQESSALWVGALLPDRWEVADAGTSYDFPRAPTGEMIYRTVEGVSWMGPRRVVAVSDRANRRARKQERLALRRSGRGDADHVHTRDQRATRRHQKDREDAQTLQEAASKEQMVHVFDLPLGR